LFADATVTAIFSRIVLWHLDTKGFSKEFDPCIEQVTIMLKFIIIKQDDLSIFVIILVGNCNSGSSQVYSEKSSPYTRSFTLPLQLKRISKV